jgi:hypothetical protein
MKYSSKTRLNIIIAILVVVIVVALIAMFFIWPIPHKIYEGAVSASDILTIVDADVCDAENKCISSSAKQKMLDELTAKIYDNNLEIKELNAKKLGLSGSDMPDGNWKLALQFMYGPVSSEGSGKSVKTVVIKENETVNLDNYKRGPLKIKKAEYYYTDSRNKSGASYGQIYYLKESEGLVNKLNARIKNNILKIDKISPKVLGVADPYYYAPNTVKGADHAENTLEITYAYGDYGDKKITAIDGENIITKLPVSD